MITDLCSSGLQDALFDEVFPPSRRISGERKLWAVVLLHGMTEAARAYSPKWRRRKGISDRTAILERIEALHWLNSDEIYCTPERGASFAWICESLDIDPGLIRAHFHLVWKPIFVANPDKRQKNLISLKAYLNEGTEKKVA